MAPSRAPRPVPSGLDRLRVELPDLAYDLERQGRLDAADVVMMLHARVRELADGAQEFPRDPLAAAAAEPSFPQT